MLVRKYDDSPGGSPGQQRHTAATAWILQQAGSCHRAPQHIVAAGACARVATAAFGVVCDGPTAGQQRSSTEHAAPLCRRPAAALSVAFSAPATRAAALFSAPRPTEQASTPCGCLARTLNGASRACCQHAPQTLDTTRRGGRGDARRGGKSPRIKQEPGCASAVTHTATSPRSPGRGLAPRNGTSAT